MSSPYTPSQGINVVRIVRDDDYCMELLHLLRRLWATVRNGEAPPDDFYPVSYTHLTLPTILLV